MPDFQNEPVADFTPAEAAETAQPSLPEAPAVNPNDLIFDDVKVGYIDRDGNIRLLGSAHAREKTIGHIANDREQAIAVLRDRYVQYLQETRDWCDETRTIENRLWRIRDCDRRIQEIDQAYVLGTFDTIHTLLTALKAELLQQREEHIARREELIREAAQLKVRTDWRDASRAFDELNEQFKAVGTAGDRHQDQLQWDTFKGHEREFRTKRREHHEQLEREFAARTEAKERLCERAEQLQLSDDFKESGRQLREMMDEWKLVGFAGKEHDEALWQRFQTARNVFNERRTQWFHDNTERKSALVARAEELAAMDDAAAAQMQMKSLMQEWRETGSAGRNSDDALWTRFRAAQESIYTRSREVFDARHRERQQNYESKQALVTEAETLLTQESRLATARAKELQQLWKKIGPVPNEFNEKQWQRFRAACDAIFRAASIEGKRRLEDARDRAEDHIRKLSAEIDEHERKIAHWEGVIANLRDGSSADEIRAAMTEKIATARERIEIKLGWIEEQYHRMGELQDKM